MPIRYCRIILALRYLRYLLKLPAHHYARAAFDDACLLHAEKKPWVGDIVLVLSRLQVPLVLKPVHLADPDSIPDLIAEVEVSCARALQRDISLFPLGEKRVIGVLAKYVFDVLSIFDAVEVDLNPELLRPNGRFP